MKRDDIRHSSRMPRRGFLRTTSLGLLGVAGGLAACDSSATDPDPGTDTTPPPNQADPATAGIRGPTWARLAPGGAVRLRYSSEFSSANAKNPVWSWVTPTGQAGGPIAGQILSMEVPAAGDWRVHLTIQNEDGATAQVEMTTTVLPALTIAGYAVPLAWTRTLDIVSGVSELCLADLDSLAQVTTLPLSIGGAGISWAPEGGRLVSSHSGGGLRHLYIVDVASGNITPLDQPPGLALDPCWSPSGEWVAYTDDTRLVTSDELTFIRADGTDRQFWAGEEVSYENHMFHASWSPDEALVAGGSTRAYVDGEQVRRIAIHSGPGRSRLRERLNPEEALVSFYGKHQDLLGPGNVRQLYEGSNGCAWSPSGDWIAYSVMLDPGMSDFTAAHALVVASASGSGEMHLLDWTQNDHDIIAQLAWAPDETALYYRRRSSILRVQPGGGPPEDLSARYGGKYAGPSVMALYG